MWSEEQVSRWSELRGGAQLQRPFGGFKRKSVREGWAGTIGLQQRTQEDKAVFVTTGIHFCWEGTMCQASVPYSTILYCTVPPLKTPVNFLSTCLTAKALWFLGGTNICFANRFFFFCNHMVHFWDMPIPGIPPKGLPRSKSVHLLSETSAVDFCDGVWSHGTPNPGACGRALGYWGDAIRRVLAGGGEGCITGHTQTVLCDRTIRPEITIRNCTMDKKYGKCLHLFIMDCPYLLGRQALLQDHQ